MENNKEIFYTSYSKMDTYKECPQQYKYRYIDNLESKGKKRSLYVGSHIHKLIELFYVSRSEALLNERKERFNQLSMMLNPENEEAHKQEVKEAFNDTLTWREYLRRVILQEFMDADESLKAELGYNYIEDLAKIMAQYEYYYTNDKLAVIDIEHDKRCSLGNVNNKDVILKYICDGVVKLPNDKIYILEHKSYSKEPMTFEQTWLNTQTSIYVSALRSAGINVEGVLWDNIKSTAPKKPNILKSGAYGKQDGNVTLFSFIDYDTIMQGPDAVREAINNLPKEIFDLGVQENYNNFLSRHITVFNEKAVDEILKDTQSVLSEITKDEPLIYRNLGWTCNGCAFKELCQAQMLGQDVSLILSTMFKPRD